jgi:hypothetical protein
VQTPCPYVGPAAGDACAAALVNNTMLVQTQAQADADATWAAGADAVCKEGGPASMGAQEMCDHVSAFRAQQLTAAQACEGNGEQRICADLLTRGAMNARILIPGTPLPCPGYDPSLPAPDSCPPGTLRASQH